jgi:hypothetical protein
MKDKWRAFLLTGLLVCFVTISTAQGGQRGWSSPAGNSYMAHLYLFEKNPGNWQIVKGGAWGKMTYRPWGPTFHFVFNGHGLQRGVAYTLIYYPDPWPGAGLIGLGWAISDQFGDVHIAGVADTGDLPKTKDKNYPYGAKIWLVLSTDVDYMGSTPRMIDWNPTKYLFEHNLIKYIKSGGK